MMMPSKLEPQAATGRIQALDSFRCLAVIMVMLVHFGNSYSYYVPYGKHIANQFLISKGYLGVQLFFMISGFVIFMTLEKCKTFGEFIIKRLTRLWPTLLFCSLLTYFFFLIFDPSAHYPKFHNSLIDFIPSLTFTDLWWDKVFHRPLYYIDGVYWTLCYEMKFYLLASAIYFIDSKNFFRNWAAAVVIIMIGYVALSHLLTPEAGIVKAVKLFLFPEYIVLFTTGMFFYLTYAGRKPAPAYTYIIIALFAGELFTFYTPVPSLVILLLTAVFAVFIYKPHWLNLLSNRVMLRIGLISYPLYLIHAHIGVFLIDKLSAATGILNPYLLIACVTLVLIGAAYMIHQYIEVPSNKLLRSYLFTKRQAKPVE